MTEQELLVDCLRRLNSVAITYYLTRSMASNYWGIPRTTHDLDFAIQLLPSSIDKIVSAFSPDYFLDQATAEDSILNKLLWNRITPSDRQLGDAAGVVAVQVGKLDIAHLKKWAELLSVSSDLNRLLSGQIRPKHT